MCPIVIKLVSRDRELILAYLNPLGKKSFQITENHTDKHMYMAYTKEPHPTVRIVQFGPQRSCFVL